MRRGLISWSLDEMPKSVLLQRLGALQAAMKEHHWQACLAYTSIAQPSAVNWLTHFTPYWSEALLVVLPSGPPVLLASLTKRVHTWIHEVSWMGEILMAPKLGENALQYLTTHLPAGSSVGVIGLESLPGSVSKSLVKPHAPLTWVDASAVFAKLRVQSDEIEIALVKKAERLAQEAFSSLSGVYTDSSTLASELELHARLGGAEEVIIRIAPDLSKDASFVRLEGELKLAKMYSVELSLAYKGVWIRLIENFADEVTTQDWQRLKAWWQQVVEDFDFTQASHVTPLEGQQLEFVRFERCQGTHPLEVVDLKQACTQSSTAWGVLSAELRSGLVHWPACQTVYASSSR